MSFTPEQVIAYNYFPKYSILKEMTMMAFSGSTSEEVDIYLDLTKIFSNLYDSRVTIQYPLSIAAVIINMCAHIRTYYRSFHQVETNFFLVYSDMNNTYNCNLIPGYNSSMFDKMEANKVTTNAINIALDALNLLCPYLPNIYFKRDIYEPMVIIYNIILRESINRNIPGIIFTKEPLMYQIPAMINNVAIFRDNKINNTFGVITKDNVLQTYLYDTNRKKLLEDSSMLMKLSTISSELLGLIITLTNLPSRNVRSIYDINKVINIIYRLISQRQLHNGYVNETNYLYSCIFNGLSKVSLEMFTLRYRAIDLLSNYDYYINTPYAKDDSYKQDLHDPQSVQAINNEYFKDTPIDLNRL